MRASFFAVRCDGSVDAQLLMTTFGATQDTGIGVPFDEASHTFEIGSHPVRIQCESCMARMARDGENRSAYWKFLEISENFLAISYSVFMNLFLLKKDS